MINTIIKRDGTEEKFQPNKINKWAEWASEHISDHVDWSHVVTQSVSMLPSKVTSTELQERLISTCLLEKTWAYNLMAGSLYGPLLQKNIFPNGIPSVKELQKKLVDLNLMEFLDYSDGEYAHIELLIDHSLDYKLPHSVLHQITHKYSIKDKPLSLIYETPQFTFMRIAMALSVNHKNRMDRVNSLYNSLTKAKLNIPTPFFTNLGTLKNGYASCCLYVSSDSIGSLSVGDHIAYVMTSMSAGIGSNIMTRSIGAPVRGGSIEHQGRLPYYRALSGAIKANLQNERGGACTTFYSCYDPEASTIALLKNPMAVEAKKIKELDYALMVNSHFVKKAANNEEVFVFNIKTAPKLMELFYSGNEEAFTEEYDRLDSDINFKKTYIKARELLVTSLNESFETGRQYLMFMDSSNYHTSFKDPIYSSNLCLEITNPTSPYRGMEDLYSKEDHGRGEIGLCSLSAINVVTNESYDEYSETMYNALSAIDVAINKSDYPLPHLEVTAKARMNAGVGIVGLAHYMAKKGLSFTSVEGKRELHRIAERHMYIAIEQSLKLSKELGLPKWNNKTKWSEGWLPIDTYNKNVDGIIEGGFELELDWENLRERVIANGGIRNSSLVAYMPSESSSKASGETNSIYPIRSLDLNKTDNTVSIKWNAPESDTLKDNYEIAWDIPTKDIIELYAIFQKFTDQSISADLYKSLIGEDRVSIKETLTDFFYMYKLGMKTRYYQNMKTSKGGYLDPVVGCAGGSCTL